MKMIEQPTTRRVIVVEDDPDYRRLVEYITKLNPDYEVHCFASGQECLNNLHLQPTVITSEYELPDMTAKELLSKVKKFDDGIEVIILSEKTDIPTVVEMIQEGAYNYIPKNSGMKDELLKTYNRLQLHVNIRKDVKTIKQNVDQNYKFEETIKGDSPAIRKIFKLLEKAAKTNITVSVTGETGTGKELAAQAIHYNSPRKQNQFVAVNVAAIPGDLLESELFGYEKGAFTGANHRKLGKFEFADKGTLFLDEIGEMDMNIQVKLLRALQEREFVRIGGNESIKFDARIIVATHRDLGDEVQKGNFREDLYYRLLGLPIQLPPLRERGNDPIILARYFLNNFSRKNDMGVLDMSPGAIEKMKNYHFPGNIRELKAVVELAAVMSEDGIIEEHNINFRSPKAVQNFLLEEVSLKEYTERIIHHYLEKYDNNVLLVAKKLKIGKSTIYRMLKGEKKDENGNEVNTEESDEEYFERNYGKDKPNNA